MSGVIGWCITVGIIGVCVSVVGIIVWSDVRYPRWELPPDPKAVIQVPRRPQTPMQPQTRLVDAPTDVLPVVKMPGAAGRLRG